MSYLVRLQKTLTAMGRTVPAPRESCSNPQEVIQAEATRILNSTLTAHGYPCDALPGLTKALKQERARTAPEALPERHFAAWQALQAYNACQQFLAVEDWGLAAHMASLGAGAAHPEVLEGLYKVLQA